MDKDQAKVVSKLIKNTSEITAVSCGNAWFEQETSTLVKVHFPQKLADFFAMCGETLHMQAELETAFVMDLMLTGLGTKAQEQLTKIGVNETTGEVLRKMLKEALNEAGMSDHLPEEQKGDA